jgi:hypothetical protein
MILLLNVRSGRKVNHACHGIIPCQIQVQYDELMFNTRKYSKQQDIDLSKFVERVDAPKDIFPVNDITLECIDVGGLCTFNLFISGQRLILNKVNYSSTLW